MGVLGDMRLVIRQWRHAPGYASMVVLTLAVAIGANSAVFSAVHAVLMRPLPIAGPDGVVVTWQTDAAAGQAVIELTYRHLREWRAASATFTQASVMGSHNWDTVLEGRGEPSRIFFNGVSAEFFETLGAKPILGRTLRPEDDVPNAPGVAVLNYSTWVRRFGQDPAIVGQMMQLDGQPVEIVGVMPEGLDIPRGAEFWVPVVPILSGGPKPNQTALDGLGVFYVIGRTRPGLSAEDARRELDEVEARLERDVPGRAKWGDRAVVVPLVEHLFGPVRPSLWALWSAVTVLLVIACANVSGLMLTRASLRRREHGVRLALGATPMALGKLWLTEVLLVAIAGGALGLFAAGWIAQAIGSLAPDDLVGVGDIGINGTVAAFTLAAVVVAALITGALPLGQLSRVNVADAFAVGERATASRQTVRARSGLLVLQIAMSVVLLIAAGLVVRSFQNLRRIDLGFEPARVLSLTVQPRATSGPPNVWFDELLRRVRAVPGVEAAGAVYLRPLVLGPIGQGVLVSLEGQPETREAGEKNPTLNHQIATPGYFEAMRIPLVSGRLFTGLDNASAPRVALVSESTARRLWPGQNPLGRRLSMSTFTPGGPPRAWRTVVGVVRDVRYRGLDEVQLDVYDPALQVGRPATNVVVRTSGGPRALVSAVHRHVRALDKTAVVDQVTTLEDVVARAMAPWRLTMWMFLLFALVAFALATMGLVSVVALDVANRRHEFAIRMALGASARSVLHAALARTAWRVAAGVGLGVIVAAFATRAMSSVLFDVAPADLVTYLAVPALVLAAASLAAYLPGRRAASTEVNTLLRHT